MKIPDFSATFYDIAVPKRQMNNFISKILDIVAYIIYLERIVMLVLRGIR